MGLIPADQADRLLRAERLRLDAVDCPIRFDVWRAFAAAGPNARVPLLLERSQDATTGAEAIADDLRQRLGALHGRPRPAFETPTLTVRVSRPDQRFADDDVNVSSWQPTESDRRAAEARVISFGEWIHTELDLFELVAAALPLTSWALIINEFRTVERSGFDELLSPTLPPAEESLLRAGLIGQRARGSWLARVFARLQGFDADIETERRRASADLVEFFAELPEASPHRSSLASINLDRKVRTAVSRSVRAVKGDAAATMFDVDCRSITWAVIDTGIDARHPAFQVSETPFETRVDRIVDFTQFDRSQYRELRAGQGFLEAIDGTLTVQPPVGPNDPDFRSPVRSHGTHVAGILGGDWTDDDGSRLTGMCPNIRLWDLRVMSDEDDGENGESRVLMALAYIREYNSGVDERSRVAGVNISLSIPYNPESFACGWTPVCVEASRLARSGVVVVVAAGNEGFDSSGGKLTAGRGYSVLGITDPGNADDVITVGATHRFQPHRYGASYFSSKGPTADGRMKPDLLAPGENIRSAVGRRDSGTMIGTSQAAPHVSGAAAMILARHSELVGQPELVKKILCETATDLGRDATFQGAGLLDVLRAIQSV